MGTESPSNSVAPSDTESNRRSPWRRRVKRIVVMTISVIVGFGLFLVVFLYLYQRKMMYFPRRYHRIETRGLPPGGVEIDYHTSQGNQVGFYIPPSAKWEGVPDHLWALFNGNASAALYWLDLVDRAQKGSNGTGFLLIDYPGYGLCEGKPTKASIDESSEAAYRALAKHLDVAPAKLDARLNVLAFSLGTGAGLDFAVNHPARRVILLAPFTSTLAMARLTVGWPLCNLLIDRFDNRARLAELARRSPPPKVDIFHGRADHIVPFSMGRGLAAEFPSMITFHAVPGADHMFLPDAVENQVATMIDKTDHDSTK